MFFHSVYAQLGFKKDKERILKEKFSRKEIWLHQGGHNPIYAKKSQLPSIITHDKLLYSV